MILMIILTLLLLAVMELNKNTLTGWVLVLCAFACFLFLRKKPWFQAGHHIHLLRLMVSAVMLVCFVISQPPVKAVPAFDGKTSGATDVVTVKQGQLTGVKSKDGTVELFTGIPYAKPPVGDLRWKEPQEPDAWEGVRTCDAYAPMSMQTSNGRIVDSLSQIIGYHDYRISLKDNYQAPMSEDSLYLNIWRPSETGGKKLPVVVYIHGGSLMTGQPWYADYAGTGLAKAGVITVNMGYRLGVFGFYGSEELQKESENGTTGNYGLLDQIQALKWVQENIAAFGGDPDNVTLAGESAGSACVSALCASPLAKGLFRRAIMESSTVAAEYPAHSFRLFEDTLQAGKDLYRDTGKSDLAGLRSLSSEELVKYTKDNHHITIDGYVLNKTPYESALAGEKLNAEEILHGYNKTESKAFMLFDKITKDNFHEKLVENCKGLVPDESVEQIEAQYDITDDKSAKAAMEEILTGLWFGYGHYCLSAQALEQDIPVYEYYFTQENGRLGSWHSGEEVYCYGNIPDGSKLYKEEDRKLSSVMLTYWRNFAETGDPNKSTSSEDGTVFDRYGNWNGEILPEWEPLKDTEHTTNFGAKDGTYVRQIDEPLLSLYRAFQ